MTKHDEASARALARLLDGDDTVPRARALLRETGSLRGLLCTLSPKRRGLSRVEARRLQNAVDFLAIALAPPRTRQLLGPEAVVAACPELWLKPHEEVWVMAVDAQLRQLTTARVGIGTANRSHVATRDVLGVAFGASAAGLFLLHNHPSGSVVPSPEDIRFTNELRSVCDAVGLQLHDHLIVAGAHWVSCVSRKVGVWFDPADRADPFGDEGTGKACAQDRL